MNLMRITDTVKSTQKLLLTNYSFKNRSPKICSKLTFFPHDCKGKCFHHTVHKMKLYNAILCNKYLTLLYSYTYVNTQNYSDHHLPDKPSYS